MGLSPSSKTDVPARRWRQILLHRKHSEFSKQGNGTMSQICYDDNGVTRVDFTFMYLQLMSVTKKKGKAIPVDMPWRLIGF
jgi:hypothetical protein